MDTAHVSQKAHPEKMPPLQENLTKMELGENEFALSQESVNVPQSPTSIDHATEPIMEEKIELEPEHSNVTVLFYDPKGLPDTMQCAISIPSRVFDADGNDVDVSGKLVLLLSPDVTRAEDDTSQYRQSPAKDVAGGTTDNKTSAYASNNSEHSTKPTVNERKMKLYTKRPRSKDQFIVMGTVLTMALLVGALSARRLRSCQWLSLCIESESLEEEMAYDTDGNMQSIVGASSVYDGGNYDTFSNDMGHSQYGGDLRWRGDLEKFDV